MSTYLTKVWGFGTPVGPLQFGQNGWRQNARDVLQDGDLVVLVGTKGKETSLEQQGRILGVVEPSREPVQSLDFDLGPADDHFDEEGNYKWPYALLNKRAWAFNSTPRLSDIVLRKFNMDSAAGIVELSPAEARQILSIPRSEVPLRKPKVKVQIRLEGDDARKRAAPPPTTKRSGVMHLRRAPAFTYLFEIRGSAENAHKVGWAFDYKSRLRTFNQYAMPLIGGLEYAPLLFELHDTAMQAYRMEQALLKVHDSMRHKKNREIIVGVTGTALAADWYKYLQRH